MKSKLKLEVKNELVLSELPKGEIKIRELREFKKVKSVNRYKGIHKYGDIIFDISESGRTSFHFGFIWTNVSLLSSKFIYWCLDLTKTTLVTTLCW